MNDVMKLPLGEDVLQIGYGRLGKPFYKHLTDLLGVSPQLIKSSKDNISKFSAKKFKYVFICTNDLSLDSEIKRWSELSETLIHFSGSLYFKNAIGAHPVYSFPVSEERVDFNSVDFVLDSDLTDSFLNTVFKRKVFINPDKKKEYHLHLSLMANYTQLLSYEMQKSFNKYVDLDSKYLFKILKQSIDSVEKSGEKSFSGPWVRGERVSQNEMALRHESLLIKNLNESFNKLINTYKEGEK